MRPPDLTIGSPPQTLRWHLFRWRGIQVAIHRWVRSDSDRALHDHSAGNVSILLTGCYREWFSHAWEAPRYKLRLPFVPYYRKAGTPHRIELLGATNFDLRDPRPLWTLWIRFRPWREWGFTCPKGWVHWRDFIDGDYSKPGSVSHIGRGCG